MGWGAHSGFFRMERSCPPGLVMRWELIVGFQNGVLMPYRANYGMDGSS